MEIRTIEEEKRKQSEALEETKVQRLYSIFDTQKSEMMANSH